MIKIEKQNIVSVINNREWESIKVGVIDKKGNLETLEFKYLTENGKVKAL